MSDKLPACRVLSPAHQGARMSDKLPACRVLSWTHKLKTAQGRQAGSLSDISFDKWPGTRNKWLQQVTTDQGQRPPCCAICGKDVGPGGSAEVDQSLRRLLLVNARGWAPGKSVCGDCLSPFVRVHGQLAASFPQFEQQDLWIIPTPMRLDAPDEWRGRGVTIAFLDS